MLTLIALTACSNQQLFGAGSAWQRNQCAQNPDSSARASCGGVQPTYSDYKGSLEKRD